jgi:hypothetical protein
MRVGPQAKLQIPRLRSGLTKCRVALTFAVVPADGESRVLLSQQCFLLQVRSGHGLPPGPVVKAVIAPDVEFVAYAFVAQDVGEALVLLPAHVPLAGGEHGADVVVLPGIGAIGQVVGRVVEIEVFTVPTVDEVLHIKGAAHGYDSRHRIGVAETKVRGVIGAEAATGGDQPRRLVLFAHQRKHIVDEVAFILHVTLHAPIGIGLLVIPTLPIDAVDAVKLQPAAVDAVGHRGNHTVVLVLKKAPPRCWEDEHFGSRVAKAEQFHVAAEIL